VQGTGYRIPGGYSVSVFQCFSVIGDEGRGTLRQAQGRLRDGEKKTETQSKILNKSNSTIYSTL
jgi:hypothetical protein